MHNFLVPLGRLFLSVIFLKSGIGKIFSFAGTQQFMEAKGMPIAALFLVFAIILEIGGGLSVLLGYKTKWGALALILFLIPTTLIFHNQLSDQVQLGMFIKNFAILGGLFMVVSFGAGPLSLDNRSSSVKTE
jgi:putative oxidoreductase